LEERALKGKETSFREAQGTRQENKVVLLSPSSRPDTQKLRAGRKSTETTPLEDIPLIGKKVATQGKGKLEEKNPYGGYFSALLLQEETGYREGRSKSNYVAGTGNSGNACCP